MDKNSIIGIVLMVALLFGVNFYNSKNEAEYQAQRQKELASQDSLKAIEQAKRDSIAALNPVVETVDTTIVNEVVASIENSDLRKHIEDSIANSKLTDKFGVFAPAAKGEDDFITFENGKIRGKISKKGGYIAEVSIDGYKTFGQEELILFDADSSFYSIDLNYKNLHTKDLYFTSNKSEVVVNEENKQESITLTLTGQNGKSIDYTYTFYADEFKVDFDVNFNNLESTVVGDNGYLNFTWKQSLPTLEKHASNEQKVATIYYYNEEEGRDYVSQLDDETEVLEYSTEYLGMRHQFFTSCLVPQESFPTGAELRTYTQTGKYFERLSAKTKIPYKPIKNSNFSSYFVFAPVDLDILSSFDANLEEQIEFGWGIISSMNEYFISPVFHWLVDQGLHVGIVILLLTIIIKMILFPITYKNYLSSAKMRVIKPQLDKINEENKDADAMKKQQAVMALYKETGVNPMAGCIPAILQMPILLAMFRFFPNAIGLRQQEFLWADDLSTYDTVLNLGFNIPMYGDHISLFTILMAISLFFYTRFNNQMTPSAAGGNQMQAKQMKMMMNFMPLMMLFVFNSSAAGLSFYYFAANLITIGQTLAIKKFFINEEAILAKIEKHKNKPMKTSKWQKKMQEIAEKQNKR